MISSINLSIRPENTLHLYYAHIEPSLNLWKIGAILYFIRYLLCFYSWIHPSHNIMVIPLSKFPWKALSLLPISKLFTFNLRIFIRNRIPPAFPDFCKPSKICCIQHNHNDYSEAGDYELISKLFTFNLMNLHKE